MNTTKTKRNVVSLPELFCNVLDNLVDNKMICNRTDALKQIIIEQHKLHPDSIKFEEKSIPISLPEWLTPRVIDEIKSILVVSDDASETNAVIAIDDVKTSLKISKEVGVDGLRELRKIRAEKKKAAEQVS